MVAIDQCHRQRADHRKSVGLERRRPLAAVLGAFPARLMRLDVVFGTLPEGRRLGLGGFATGHQRDPAGVALLDRVDAIDHQQALRLGQLAGILEAHVIDVTEPHLSGPATDHEPEYPSLGITIADLEIKAVAITVETRRNIGLLYPFIRKLIDWPPHGSPCTNRATYKTE